MAPRLPRRSFSSDTSLRNMESTRAGATTSTGIPRSKLSTRSRDLISPRSTHAKTARLPSCRMGKPLYENRAALFPAGEYSHRHLRHSRACGLRDFRTRSSPKKSLRRPHRFRLRNKTRFLERQKCAAFLHRFEAFCGYADGDLLAEFRNEKRLRLEIDLAAAFAGRVEFGRADAVGVPAADLGAFACDITYSCHSSGMLAWGS